MPGIAGLITRMPADEAQTRLHRMIGALRHEPFYVTGTCVDEDLGLYAGWTARKGSSGDGMPLHSERGDVSLVFSGEDFADPLVSRKLRERGHIFEAEGPSYLVHLYEEDPAFPVNLNGRFHGLAADRQQSLAMLFNDRYGMHRLYYHESKDAFYFAAEAKAILAVCPELRTMDPQGMSEFISCGCVLENRTIFKGIQVLPPAANWIFRGGTLERKQSYFEPREWEEQEPLEPELYYREIRKVFSRNLSRYFMGGEQIGMSLTGGLDTRMIMAWRKPLPGSLPCYSFGSMFRDCQDVVMARRVATACGQTHTVIPVAREFLSRFSHYAERAVYLTDGCISVNHAADLYVNQHAAQIAPVRMTGNYGGEVLRRVRAFKPMTPAAGLFAGDLLPEIEEARRTYARSTDCHPLSFAVFRQAPWHHYGLLSLEQTQLSLRSPFLDNDFVRTVFRAPQAACKNNAVSLRLIAEGDADLARMRTDRGVTGSGDIRERIIRGFMDFTFKTEYAYDYGMPQWMARIDHVLSGCHLEKLFLGRHKFYHYRVWYRGALSAYVREMLLDSRTLSRSYLERRTVESIVHGHLETGRNYTTEIHKLLTLELISRSFLDPQ